MSPWRVLRIGTRTSRLARIQAALAADAIIRAGLASRTELAELKTSGDEISEAHPRGRFLASDGQFTAELERALLDGRADVAVHSFKDLPLAAGLGVVVAAVLERADARDALVSRHAGGIEALPRAAAVGTGSARREAQLLAARGDLVTRPIRGNVDTRLKRVRDGEYDAVLLACAGLDRLGVEDADGLTVTRLPFEVMLPAPAQAALALQVRADRRDLLAALRSVDHPPTRIAAEIERTLLARIGGGCLSPMGVLAEVRGDAVRLRAAYASPEGSGLIRVERHGRLADRDRLVADAADGLLAAAGAAP